MAKIDQGPKKPGPEAHSVMDPQTGELVVATKAIQNVFLQHCQAVLKTNPRDKEFEEDIEIREKLIEEVMAEASDDFEATEEGFEGVIEKFKKNNKRGYDFLVRSSSW